MVFPQIRQGFERSDANDQMVRLKPNSSILQTNKLFRISTSIQVPQWSAPKFCLHINVRWRWQFPNQFRSLWFLASIMNTWNHFPTWKLSVFDRNTWNCMCIYPIPPIEQEATQSQFFYRILTVLNWEFSFS